MTPLSSTSLFGEKERTIAVRPGLDILYGEFRLREPRQFHFKTYGDTCQFAFVLSGTIVNRFPCLGKDIVVPPKHAAFWLMPELYAIHECSPDEDIRFACVRIRRDLLAEIIREDMNRLPLTVRELMEYRENGVYHDISTMNEPMLNVAQQFFTCPYKGTTEKLFFEGKALELVSHFMASFLKPGRDLGTSDSMPQDARIQHAQRILIDNMAQPPSLSALAQIIGLSQASLTRGFRKVIGMSVFEFLREQRLEKARVLLESSTMNVTEVAYSVGFSSPSHLTRLFNRRFNVTPGAYRRNHFSDQ